MMTCAARRSSKDAAKNRETANCNDAGCVKRVDVLSTYSRVCAPQRMSDAWEGNEIPIAFISQILHSISLGAGCTAFVPSGRISNQDHSCCGKSTSKRRSPYPVANRINCQYI
jgi:hypothetical protein